MSDENKEWKEVQNSTVIKLEDGKRLEGKLIRLEESKQYPNSWAVTLEKDDETKTVFVNSICKDKLTGVSLGTEVAILNVGLKKNQDGTREYRDWAVFHK